MSEQPYAVGNFNFMEEIWKDAHEHYEVSNLGNIRSKDRIITDKGGRKRLFKSKNILPCDNGNGYKIVSFNNNSKRIVKYIHRLVAEAFIPNPDKLPEVNHIYGIKSDNRASELEWCTRSKNLNGFRTPIKRRAIMQFDLFGNLIQTYDNVDIAAEKYNCTTELIMMAASQPNFSCHTAVKHIWIYCDNYNSNKRSKFNYVLEYNSSDGRTSFHLNSITKQSIIDYFINNKDSFKSKNSCVVFMAKKWGVCKRTVYQLIGER